MYNLKDRQKIREIISFTRRKRSAWSEVKPLRPNVPDSSKIEFYIDPGYAKAEEIGEFFSQLSTLYEMMGGAGINFTVMEARKPIYAHESKF